MEDEIKRIVGFIKEFGLNESECKFHFCRRENENIAQEKLIANLWARSLNPKIPLDSKNLIPQNIEQLLGRINCFLSSDDANKYLARKNLKEYLRDNEHNDQSCADDFKVSLSSIQRTRKFSLYPVRKSVGKETVETINGIIDGRIKGRKGFYDIQFEFFRFSTNKLSRVDLEVDFQYLNLAIDELGKWAQNCRLNVWNERVLPLIEMSKRNIDTEKKNPYFPILILKVQYYAFNKVLENNDQSFKFFKDIEGYSRTAIEYIKKNWNEKIEPPKNLTKEKVGDEFEEINFRAGISSSLKNNLALFIFKNVCNFNRSKKEQEKIISDVKNLLDEALEEHFCTGIASTILSTASTLKEKEWGEETWRKLVDIFENGKTKENRKNFEKIKKLREEGTWKHIF